MALEKQLEQQRMKQPKKHYVSNKVILSVEVAIEDTQKS